MVASISLQAAIIASDDFESYGLGELNGGSGGTGFASSWVAATSVTEVVTPANSLTSTPSDADPILGGSKALELSGNQSSAVGRELGVTLTDTFYVSFQVQMPAGTISDNLFAALYIQNPLFVGAPSVGIKANEGPGDRDFMGRSEGNREVYGDEQLAVGSTTYRLLAKVSKTGGSAIYNNLEFWLNPNLGDELTPDGVSSLPAGTTTGVSAVDTIGFRTVNLTSDDRILVDNIIVSDSFEDHFTVPEPSSILLISV